MSFTPTTNYALQKPTVGTELDAWGDDLSSNWDIVDSRMKINADAAAAATTLAGSKANAVHTHAASDITSGQFASAQIADAAITNAKLAAMAANTIKGSVSGGVPADLTGAQVAAIVGSTTTITDDSVTNAKLANMAANTIKGAVTAGDPVDLSAAQVLSITGAATATQLTDAVTKEVQNAQSGSYALAIGDVGKMVTFSGTATLTINSGIFSAGHRIDILQLGSGAVTFGGTATRRVFPSGATKLAGQYAGATIWFTTTANECVIIGNIIV